MAFIKINRLLNKSVGRAKIRDKVEASLVMEEFLRQLEKLFGKQISRKVKPVSLKNQVLKVSVMSSVLTAEIKLKQKILIASINSKFGKTLVKKIISTL